MKRYIDVAQGLIATVDANGVLRSVIRHQPISGRLVQTAWGDKPATIRITIDGANMPLSDDTKLSSGGIAPGV